MAVRVIIRVPEDHLSGMEADQVAFVKRWEGRAVLVGKPMGRNETQLQCDRTDLEWEVLEPELIKQAAEIYGPFHVFSVCRCCIEGAD